MSTRRISTTDKRQKSQYSLAFLKESRGAAPTDRPSRAGTLTRASEENLRGELTEAG